jgi:hypothetical protein
MKTTLYNSITVISDCCDNNARGRIMTRLYSLLPKSNITFIGVQNDIEAAICLVDTLDALENRDGTILVNVAPRNGRAKKWPNGTPFGEFNVGKIKVFSTIDGYVLGFVQKFLKQKIRIKVYDIPKVVSGLRVSPKTQNRIINSQFRSFDFLTRLAVVRIKGRRFPYNVMGINEKIDWVIGYIDKFQKFENVKTTRIYNGEYRHGDLIGKLKIGNKFFSKIKFYSRLKDVPDNELAIIVGSSGLGEKRLLEIVLQGGSAKKKLGNPLIGTPVQIL